MFIGRRISCLSEKLARGVSCVFTNRKTSVIALSKKMANNEWKKETAPDRDRERQTETDRDRQRQRETETERDRERKRERSLC